MLIPCNQWSEYWHSTRGALGLSSSWDLTFHHLLHLAPNICHIFLIHRVKGQIFIKRGNMAPGQRACDYQFNNASCMIRTLAGMIRQKIWVWVPFETKLYYNLSHLCHSLWLPLVYWLLPPFFFTGRSFSRGKQKRKVL